MSVRYVRVRSALLLARATVQQYEYEYATTRSPEEMAAQYGRGWTQGWGDDRSVASKSKAGSKGSRSKGKKF